MEQIKLMSLCRMSANGLQTEHSSQLFMSPRASIRVVMPCWNCFQVATAERPLSSLAICRGVVMEVRDGQAKIQKCNDRCHFPVI